MQSPLAESLGHILDNLLWLAVVILASIAIWFCLKRTLLPFVAEHIRAFLTGDNGNYQSADDELHRLVESIRESRDADRLTELEAYCVEHPQRLRAWQEYANLLHSSFKRSREASRLLERAASTLRSKEDRALMLYRAAIMQRDSLQDVSEAQRLLREAATSYPQSTYGKLAALQLHGDDLS